MRLTILLLLLPFLGFTQPKIVAESIGEAKTKVSYIKEVIEWNNGIKTNAESFAGDRIDLFISDRLIKIEEKDTTYTYKVDEVQVDELGNAIFKGEDNTVLHLLPHRNLFQIQPAGNTQEIIYYLE